MFFMDFSRTGGSQMGVGGMPPGVVGTWENCVLASRVVVLLYFLHISAKRNPCRLYLSNVTKVTLL